MKDIKFGTQIFYSQNYDSIPIFLDTITLNKSTFESKKVGLSSIDNF